MQGQNHGPPTAAIRLQIRFLVSFFFTQLRQFAKISRVRPNTEQPKNNEVVLTEEL